MEAEEEEKKENVSKVKNTEKDVEKFGPKKETGKVDKKNNDKVKDGEENKESPVSSPLAAVGPLLRLYSWMGLFPAGMDKEYRNFKVQWFRYLILLGTWLAFAAVAAACYQFSSDNGPEDDPLEPGEGKGGGGGGGGQEWSDATLAVSTPPSATVEADVEEVEELNGSFIDRIFVSLLEYVTGMYVFFVIWTNHSCIKTYSELVRRFTAPLASEMGEEEEGAEVIVTCPCLECGYGVFDGKKKDVSPKEDKEEEEHEKEITCSRRKRLSNKLRRKRKKKSKDSIAIPMERTLSAREPPSSPRIAYKHHATVLVLTGCVGVCASAASYFNGTQREEGSGTLLDQGKYGAIVMLEILAVLKQVYMTILLSIPDVVIVRFQDTVSRQIKADLLDSVASSPCEFCARQERHRENCKALYAKLGTSLLVSVGFTSLLLLFSSYYLLLYAMGKILTSSPLEQSLNVLCWALTCAMNLKRLAHLANHSQALIDAFGAAAEKLIRAEAKDYKCNPKIKSVRRLLCRAEEGSSVLGLFTVNRGMLLVIAGEILTYLIIMIEFKNEEETTTDGGTSDSSKIVEALFNHSQFNMTSTTVFPAF